MPHMLAQEHMGFVDPLRYEPHTRTSATLAAALSAIGSSIAILVITQEGDGVWTLSTNLVIPANVTLWIPAGVNISRNAGVTLTILGPLISFNPNWETGPGTTVRNVADGVFTEFTRLVARSGYNAPFDGQTYVAGVNAQRQILLNTRIPTGNSTDNCAVFFYQAPQGANDGWEMGINTVKQFYIARPGAFARLGIDTGGVGIATGAGGFTPAHALQMFVDDAFKATASWSVPSDARLKTVVGDYTDGLAMLQALPQAVRFVFNGKAQTPTDGKEQIGMLAQDVQPVAPYMITSYQDKLDPADAAPTDIFSMNNGSMVYALVNAVKDLAAQITALTDRVAALEAKVP
jgi:hypothetical protein